MSNLIKKEQTKSKEFNFDTEKIDYNGKKKEIVKITTLNVAKVEAMIKNDSAYLKSVDKNQKPNGKKYRGSSAYWINCLKSFEQFSEKPSYEEIIENIVEAIDRENSTHLNSDNYGRKVVINRIIEIGREKLIDYLKNPGKEYYLVKKIKEKPEKEELDKIFPNNDSSKAKKYYSFATKFCHYVSFYLFENEKEQDNFSIYDGVLENALPLYMKKYQIDKKDRNFENYADYIEIIDEIRNKAEEKVSRNGFDHLLWYYHKGRK